MDREHLLGRLRLSLGLINAGKGHGRFFPSFTVMAFWDRSPVLFRLCGWMTDYF